MQITANVQQYLDRGMVKYDKVLAISLHSRVPNLTHVYGFDKVHEIMIVLLTSFQNALNLIRPMSPEQLINCAYELVMTSEEDQLAIEDYVLFFRGAAQGKYGKILDRLDQQTVFDMLEQYRQARHQEFLRIKETKHLELKGMGPGERTTEKNPMEESFYNIAGRLGELKEKLKEQREINRAGRL